MTSLSDPPCLIEHELYVENAVWILHTLSTQEYSSNEHSVQGEGVLRYFHTYVGLGHFWAQILNFNILFGFQKNEYFLGV